MHAVATTTRETPLGMAFAFRHELADGSATTVHAAVYERAAVALSVVAMAPAEPLADWCARAGVRDALVGGFFVTPVGTPLGELWIAGARHPTTPFDAPWGGVRACVAIDGELIRLATRPELPAAPAGDLLQAGPLLVRDGVALAAGDADAEGFAAGSAQFDSDITDGRHPRAALGLDERRLIAVACDGRADDEAGLTLPELASLMAGLGARAAINLDGGGSATLVAGGRMRNRPREAWGAEVSGGRPLATALALRPRVAAASAGHDGVPAAAAL